MQTVDHFTLQMTISKNFNIKSETLNLKKGKHLQKNRACYVVGLILQG